MRFAFDYADNINKCFWFYLKLTSPDRISSIYQLMFIIFKVSYHYHCIFQNISFSLKSTAADREFSLKKFLDFMIGAFQIVFQFFNNSFKPAPNMTYFIDIYLRLKRAEHQWSIRYFVIFAKAERCHRLEVLVFEI